MRRLAVVCILVMAGFTRTARADLASSIYGDVQDVVQELIETEVTTSVVAKLKDKSPALGFYMHGTLERMASPYWGSLGRTLKSEITVLIADFVYWHMTNTSGPNHAPERDIAKSATAFFQCAIGKTTNTPECKRLLDAVAHARPLLDVECKRRMSERDHRTACDVGLAVQAALEGRKEVRHHVIDALTNVVLQEVGKDRELLEAASTILSRWLDKLDGTIPVALFEALGSPEMIEQLKDESLEKLCGRPTGEKPPAIGPKDVQKNVDWQKDVLLWNRDVKSVRDNANAFFDDFTKPGWICQ
ncbi:MAG TPA: hypothetical protein VLB44_04850, partial [Kofleriaceae bacterium]|nr:hypothetical protein [Kofleriaceae bacterium]